MTVIQTLQTAIGSNPVINQYLLNPIGILALLAFIPLAIFYLVKPKPEEQIMPAMRFFQKEEGRSQLKKAFRTLLRNFVLLLQILTIIGFAIVLAEPFSYVQEQSDNTVVILDRSASMNGNFGELKNRVESNLGEKNTLILVDSDVQVQVEEAPASEIKRILDRTNPVQTETDIISALDTARNYRGELVIASDLDQTVDQRSVREKLDSHASRSIEILKPETENKWGITDVEPGRNETYVEITSFMETQQTLEVENNGEKRQLSLEPDSTVRVSFPSQTGRNTVELPEDELSVDNTAYYSIPESETINVAYAGPVNQYFSTAVDLINTTELRYVQEDVSEAEIYVLGGENIRESKVSSIEQKVNQGASAVVFADSNALGNTFGFNTTPKAVNRSVSINEPQRIPLGQTEIIDKNIAGGESVTTPSSAIRIHQYGEGNLMAYNIDESGFRQDFLYPVFWEAMFSRLSDKPGVDELNFQTGEELDAGVVNSPEGQRFEGRISINQSGFYTSGDTVYASNLESEDESSLEDVDFEPRKSHETSTSRKNMQHMATVLLLALIFVEVIYLWYRGDL